jgi:hypothetical protein
MVFWWTGRGYLALLSLIGVYGVFGAIVTFATGGDAFERWRWLWAVGAVLSAAVTWWLGCRINGRSYEIRSLKQFRRRLYYPADHRFVSLPVENWAFAMLGLAAMQLFWSFLPPSID